MTDPFTSDQEARIAEIVGMVMRGINAATPSSVATAALTAPAVSGAPYCNLPEEEIAARYRLGENAIQLSAEYGVSSETIYRVTRAHGIKPGSARPRGPRGRHADKYVAIAEAYEAGKTLLECEAEFGVGQEVIKKALRAFNVAVRPKGTRFTTSAGKGGCERMAQIMAMRAEGKTLEQIGAVLNITRERVRQLVVKAGLSNEFAKRPLSTEQKAIIQEYANGLGLVLTAEKLGVSLGVTKKWLLQEGIELRPANRFARRSAVTTANAERAAQLYQQGHKGREIAAILGMKKPASVYRLLAIAGIRPTRNPAAGRIKMGRAA